jgi:hypothetical protein
MKTFNVNTDNNDTWLTPPEIIKSLGEFDLDPCSPINRPWNTAKNHFTIEDDGLSKEWFGRVWLNPPYGRAMELWLEKMSRYLNGIGLLFARTETKAFQNYIFPFADSLFFIKGRLSFYTVEGVKGGSSAAPSLLIGYNEANSDVIADSGLQGAHIWLKGELFYFGLEQDERSWKVIVNETLSSLGKESTLEEIYTKVISLAPTRVKKNPHYKAKIRQILQKNHTRITTGVYVN